MATGPLRAGASEGSSLAAMLGTVAG
jgi:hypothetical protein